MQCSLPAAVPCKGVEKQKQDGHAHQPARANSGDVVFRVLASRLEAGDQLNRRQRGKANEEPGETPKIFFVKNDEEGRNE